MPSSVVRGIVRSASPLKEAVLVGEIPPTYVGMIVPHNEPWDFRKLEPLVYWAHLMGEDARPALVAKPSAAGDVGYYLKHPEFFLEDPSKLPYELIFLAGGRALSTVFDLIPAYREKDPGGAREKMELNSERMVKPAVERLNGGQSVLLYSQGTIVPQEIAPWSEGSKLYCGGFVLAGLADVPVLPIVVYRKDGGVLIGTGKPIAVEAPAADSALPNRAQRKKWEGELAESYKEVYAALGLN